MYSNITEYKNKLYVTEVNEENNKLVTSYHVIDDFKPELYVETYNESKYKGFPYKNNLEKIEFESIKEYNDYVYRMKDVQDNLYGSIDIKYQYINKMYNKNDTVKPRTWFADIETDVTKGRFPTPENEAITFIQIYDNIEDLIYILTWSKEYTPLEPDVKYIYCGSEYDMCDKFLKLYYHFKPSCVTGINFVHFDTNYLIKRLDILGFQKNILSPFGKSYTHRYKKFNKNYEVEMPIGVTWIDYMDIVDAHAYLKLGGKSLEVLSEAVLGEENTKLKWKRYFKSFHDMVHYIYRPPYDITDDEKQEPIYKAYMNKDEELVKTLAHEIFVKYSILDVRLLKEIDKKLAMMDIMFSFSWNMGCNLEDALKTVVPWDTLLYGKLKEKNLITASFHHKDEKYSIAGGFWDSTPGFYKWIISYDFKSQYPIGAVTLNICPSTHINNKDIPKDLLELVKPLQKHTIDGKLVDRDTNMITYLNMSIEDKEKIRLLCEKYNYTFAPNGTFYTKDFKGELPILIEEIFNERLEYQRLMDEYYALGDTNNGGIFNNKQQISKIKINSLYGYVSSKYFKLGSPDLGGAITAFGRYSLLSMKKAVNDKHKQITGNDIITSSSATDANYFVLDEIVKMKYPNATLEEGTNLIKVLIDKVFQPLVNENINNDFYMVNGYKNMMSLTREVIASHGLITGISKYTLRLTDNKGKSFIDKPKQKTVGMPNISVTLSKNIKKALDKVVQIIFDGDNLELVKFIDTFRKEFETYKPTDIAQLMGVSSVDKYKDATKDIFWVSKASMIYNNIVKKHDLEDEFDLVGENDKVHVLFLNKNPITRAETLAFKDDEFLVRMGLDRYIDRDKHFNNLFLEAVKTFCETINWNTNANSLLLDDLF